MTEETQVQANNGNELARGEAKQGGAESFADEMDMMVKQVLAETKGTPLANEAAEYVTSVIIGLTAETLMRRYEIPGPAIARAMRGVADNAVQQMRARGVWKDEVPSHSLAGYL
jgi:hypothetical protein